MNINFFIYKLLYCLKIKKNETLSKFIVENKKNFNKFNAQQKMHFKHEK